MGRDDLTTHELYKGGTKDGIPPLGSGQADVEFQVAAVEERLQKVDREGSDGGSIRRSPFGKPARRWSKYHSYLRKKRHATPPFLPLTSSNA